MADLSQDERDIIAKHPLNSALDHLRDSLQKAEQCFKCDPTFDGPALETCRLFVISKITSSDSYVMNLSLSCTGNN